MTRKAGPASSFLKQKFKVSLHFLNDNAGLWPWRPPSSLPAGPGRCVESPQIRQPRNKKGQKRRRPGCASGRPPASGSVPSEESPSGPQGSSRFHCPFWRLSPDSPFPCGQGAAASHHPRHTPRCRHGRAAVTPAWPRPATAILATATASAPAQRLPATRRPWPLPGLSGGTGGQRASPRATVGLAAAGTACSGFPGLPSLPKTDSLECTKGPRGVSRVETRRQRWGGDFWTPLPRDLPGKSPQPRAPAVFAGPGCERSPPPAPSGGGGGGARCSLPGGSPGRSPQPAQPAPVPVSAQRG